MPIPHYEVLGHGLKELTVSEMVRLCIDTASERCWLELTNFSDVYPGTGSGSPIRIYIGAYQQGGAWLPMDPGKRPSTYAHFDLAGSFGAVSKITTFQRAIVAEWQSFDSRKISHFAKGTTFGKSFTSASFAAKALKTGFDAVGMPAPAYSGIKVSGWTPSDLIKYAKSRQGLLGFRNKDLLSMSDLVSDFMELPPLAKYDGKAEPAVPGAALPDKKVDLIPSAKGGGGLFAYAKELENIPFPRVVAYGFRGDSRSPLEFKTELKNDSTGKITAWMQGFLPGYTRPGHNKGVEDFKASADFKAKPDKKNPAWVKHDGTGKSVKEVDEGALDLRNYIANEFMGGYISLTRYAMVARSFGAGIGGNRAATGGWVYCCLAEGAFNIPRKGEHPWATKNEAELAMPGMLEWDDVVGFRQVTPAGDFTGPVYLRKSLHAQEPTAFPLIFKIFSGMNQ